MNSEERFRAIMEIAARAAQRPIFDPRRPDEIIGYNSLVTWSDGARANVSFAPFLAKGGVFEPLKNPDYFVREMRLMRDGIGLTWPNEVDFSAEGLRQDAFPAEATGEVDEKAPATSDRMPSPPRPVP